jgi:hypothetical protein
MRMWGNAPRPGNFSNGQERRKRHDVMYISTYHLFASIITATLSTPNLESIPRAASHLITGNRADTETLLLFGEDYASRAVITDEAASRLHTLQRVKGKRGKPKDAANCQLALVLSQKFDVKSERKSRHRVYLQVAQPLSTAPGLNPLVGLFLRTAGATPVASTSVGILITCLLHSELTARNNMPYWSPPNTCWRSGI